MTLKKISELTGLSISTVSRILNNEDYRCSNKEAQELVWKIVMDSGYFPNSAAKALKFGSTFSSGSTKTVTCVFARTEPGTHDTFFTAMESAIKQEAMQLGMSIGHTIYLSDLDPNFERSFIKENKNHGFIILGRYDESKIAHLLEYTKNVITAGLYIGKANCDHIFIDDYKLTYKLLNYLVKLGHRQIGYLGETTRDSRFNNYLNFMKEKNLPVEDWQITHCTQSFKGGYYGAKSMASSGRLPSACFCANDIASLGAMKAFRESDIYIPKDLSIISIDDIELAQLATPPLTTIKVQKEEMSKVALRTLLDRMNSGHYFQQIVEIAPGDLLIRGSCEPYN